MRVRLVRGVAFSLVAVALAARPQARSSTLLQRFLALDDPDPVQYRALRHLEADNTRFDSSARMDVWTEADANGFRYQIVSQEGSEYIRSRIFKATLETERTMWGGPSASRAAFTIDNYVFEDRGVQHEGLSSLTVKPRRKDMLLVDGALYLDPIDGELMRMEGTLARTPSFWTRRVEIRRWYKRFVGVRLPIAVESVANVHVAGRSTFRMTYAYESVNGTPVAVPHAP